MRAVSHNRHSWLFAAALAALPSLQVAAQTLTTWIGPTGGSWSVPGNWSGGVVPANGVGSFAVVVPASRNVLFDLLTPTTLSSLQVTQGSSTVQFAGLTNSLTVQGAFSGAVSLTGGTFVASGGTLGIQDGGRVFASGGAIASMASIGYSAASLDGVTLFSAGGATTIINLSTFQTFAFGSPFGQRTQTIAADNAGLVDLSGLTTINDTSGQDDELRFSYSGGGTINLNALATINAASGGNSLNRVTFSVGAGSLNLPALQTINGGANLTLGSSVTANLNALQAHNGYVNTPSRSVYSLGDGAVLNANALTTLNFVTVTQNPGSSLNAPNLTNISGSILELSPGFTFNTGTLSQIDNARIAVSGGLVYNRVSDTTYTSINNDGATIFSATSLGSSLNLSSLQSLTFGSVFGQRSHVIAADANGLVDLSGLTTINDTSGQDDELRFSYSGGGTINLNALATINAASGGNSLNRVTFSVGAGSLNLPALQTINGGANLTLGSSVTANLNALQAHNGYVNTPSRSVYSLGDGAVLNANALTTLNFVTVTQNPGSSLNAPNLTNISGSILELSPGFTFNTGTLSQIDNARIAVSGGLVYNRVSDTTYTSINNDGATIFSATSLGSSLNLSSLQSLTFGSVFGQRSHVIAADANGLVDLSGLTTINDTSGQDDELRFSYSGGGTINLNALATINAASGGNSLNRVTFSVGAGSLNLPALQTINGGANLTLGSSVTANLNALQAHNGYVNTPSRSVYSLGDGAVLNANALTTLNFVTVTQNPGSSLNAPNLTNISGSILELSPGFTFNTGTLSQIDNARIAVSGGLVYNRVSDTTYTSINNDGATIFSASGPGSVLNLASLGNLTFGSVFGARTHTINADGNGYVNLAGLQTIKSTPGENDALQISATGSGSINLSGLLTIDVSGNNRARFVADTGGLMLVRRLNAPAQFQFTAANSGVIDVAESVVLPNTGTVTLSANGRLRVAGDFTHAFTTETNLQATAGVLELAGDNTQILEVAGADSGSADPGNNGNFGFGQLVVGQSDQATVVQLVDLIDNGNRGVGDAPEALYLFGLGGPPGLVMHGGSSLILNNLNVYTTENGSWTSLQGLFTGGQTVVPYTFNGSDGFLVQSEPQLLLIWVSPSDGSWSIPGNWDQNMTPDAPYRVRIAPNTGVLVAGPTADAQVRELTVDAGSGTTTLALTGPGTLTVSNGLIIGSRGQINLTGGNLKASVLFNSSQFNQSASTNAIFTSVVNSGSISSAGSLSLTGAMLNNGLYTQSSGTASMGALDGTGSTTLGASASVTVNRVRQKALSVDGQLVVRPNGSSSGTSVVESLSIAGAGFVDVHDNDLILDYTGPTPVQSIRLLIRSGFLSGAGLLSSHANAITRLGYADNTVTSLATFSGQPVDATSILVKFTYAGDANLDGQVDISDLAALATAWQTPNFWTGGDFNYDGFVDISDLAALATNWQAGVGAPLAMRFKQALATVGFGGVSVPEPATVALLVATLVLARRRRIASS